MTAIKSQAGAFLGSFDLSIKALRQVEKQAPTPFIASEAKKARWRLENAKKRLLQGKKYEQLQI